MRRLFFFLLAVAIVSFALLTSLTPHQGLRDKYFLLLEKQNKVYPHEKVYLHMDKPYYVIGDTIWFAGYLVNSVNNQPSNISNILYVDFINSSAQIVIQKKLKVQEGFTKGQIPLLDSLNQDIYTIRAYTAWMCNFDSDYLFTKQINVFNRFPEGFMSESELIEEGNQDILNLNLTYNGTDAGLIIDEPVRYRIRGTKLDIRGNGTFNSKGVLAIKESVSSKEELSKLSVELQYTDKQKKKRKESVDIVLPEKNKILVRFFPEGGQILEEFPSRIAFEVRDNEGNPIETNGLLKNGEQIVVNAQSNSFGYGAFTFIPVKGDKYELLIEHEGKQHIFSLPDAKDQGVSLICDNQKMEEIKVKIFGNFKKPEHGQNMLLIGHVRGEPIFITPVSLSKKGLAQVVISKESCPQGILHVTLVTSKGNPCAERILFIDKKEYVKVNISSQTKKHKTKERTIVDIYTADQNGNPTPARFSLSGLDASQLVLPDSTEDNIYSYLLLTSDLKGKIDKPGYYFTDASDAKRDLDLLMLTQGWRRFNVDYEEADSIYPIKFAVEKKLGIFGEIKNVKPKRIKDYSITMMAYEGIGRISEIRYRNLNQDGTFTFLFDDFFGEQYVKLFTRNHRNRLRDVNLSLYQNPNPPFVALKDIPNLNMVAHTNQKIADQRMFLQNSIDKQIYLDEITVVHRKKDVNVIGDVRYDATQEPDYVLTGEELKSYSTVMNAIQMHAPSFREGHDEFGDLILRAGTSQNDKYVNIIIDDMPSDVYELKTLHVSNVGSIRIYRRLVSMEGLIVVNTKPGTSYTPGSVNAMLKGFDEAREYYIPVSRKDNSITSDYRTTIFWKADIATDSTGYASVVLLNSDNLTTVKLRAEGMTQQGIPAFGEGEYEVTLRD